MLHVDVAGSKVMQFTKLQFKQEKNFGMVHKSKKLQFKVQLSKKDLKKTSYGIYVKDSSSNVLQSKKLQFKQKKDVKITSWNVC